MIIPFKLTGNIRQRRHIVPDPSIDNSFEDLLTYRDSPESETFVLDVMQGVRRQQKIRSLILSIFGTIGALFGIAGAVMLSDPITWLFTEVMTPTGIMQSVLGVVAVVSFYTWFMNEDLSIAG